jgi:cytochrome c biogenesis protein CcmG/thiol:disulfide interchange protein DsbE
MSVEQEASRKPRIWLVLLPLAIFLLLAVVFLAQLLSGRDNQTIPSALIGQPAPATSLPPLDGMDLPGLDSAALYGKVTLVNVWASWCAPCRQEHPLLMVLSANPDLQIAGLNYKDRPENARRFLGDLGNPYDAIGVDNSGRAAIDWGVYGVPESFLVGRDGRIVWKHVGPFDDRSVREGLLPELEKALAAGS